MTAGKAASQAGHAFLASFLKAPFDIANAYVADDGGCKVVLSCPDEATLWQIYRLATDAGLPCHLWLEGNDRLPTAVGIGPVDRAKAKPIVKRLKLM